MRTTTEKTVATAPKMGVFSTSEALAVLWNRVESKLKPHEIEWFANGAAQQVNTDTAVLADVLMDIGGLVATDTEVGSFNSSESVSNLLFNLSSQLSTLSGLSEITNCASFLVRQSLKGQS